METTILEGDTTEKSNVATEEVKTSPEKEVATDVETKETEQPAKEETQEEATFEVDGEKLSVSQIRKLKEEYANDSKWKDKNRRESEELNRVRKELGPLELIKPYLEQRPELLQQILQPKQSRDLDKELRSHYDQREALPRDANGNYDYRAYVEWEMKRDKLTTEQASMLSEERVRKELSEEAFKERSSSLERKWSEEYVKGGKLSQDEFLESLKWIVENVNIRNGKIPDEAMSIAYRVLHEEKYLREVKLDAAKKTVAPFLKAKQSVVGDGKNKQDVPTTDQDDDDNDFVNTVKVMSKKYQRLS